MFGRKIKLAEYFDLDCGTEYPGPCYVESDGCDLKSSTVHFVGTESCDSDWIDVASILNVNGPNGIKGNFDCSEAEAAYGSTLVDQNSYKIEQERTGTKKDITYLTDGALGLCALRWKDQATPNDWQVDDRFRFVDMSCPLELDYYQIDRSACDAGTYPSYVICTDGDSGVSYTSAEFSLEVETCYSSSTVVIAELNTAGVISWSLTFDEASERD